MKKIFISFILFLLSMSGVSAGGILVENIFSDIDSDYEYRDELQTLYDRGMIIPNASGKFAPESYLNRDEFVGISMEVICERCIQPHTDIEFIQEYFTKDVYFDIKNHNPYFYCIAEADANNYVRGYGIGESCENGNNQFGERPFCPGNKINLEEAVAVLLRNSGIFTIDDNQDVIGDIYAGNISAKLGNDVSPTDAQGSPYTFYGYIRKALQYEILEYNSQGHPRSYTLLEPDAFGNINPNRAVTKEEFLRMAYIALKSNSCSEIQDEGLALDMDIFDASCDENSQDTCQKTDFNAPDNQYDFGLSLEGFCDAGVTEPSGYIWRFHHLDSGQQFIRYGKYIDNYTFSSTGNWRVYLRVVDNCGNSSEVYSSVFIGDNISDESYIDADIDVYDDDCSALQGTCREIEFSNQEDDGDHIFDFDGDVSTSCNIGSIQYNWTFTHLRSGEVFRYSQEYIDDIFLGRSGEWKILLEVEDGCGNKASETLSYRVYDIEQEESNIDVDIDIYDDACASAQDECLEIEFSNQEDDGDHIFDFDGDVSTSCNIGSIQYNWTFTHLRSGEVFRYSQEYIDDIFLGRSGEWKILLEVEDGCGNKASETLSYRAYDIEQEESNIDVDIDIYDDACASAQDECLEIEFSNQEDDGDHVFDFDGDVSTSCNIGSIQYDWTFTQEDSNSVYEFRGEYVNDFSFLYLGVWNIVLRATDGCGNTASESLEYVVSDTVTSGIDVSIDASPIYGPEDLHVDFSAFVGGGNGPFVYEWDFGDGGSGFSGEIDHLYTQEGIYEVELQVWDANGVGGTASVVIMVLPQDACLKDSDGDGIIDCDDLCPLVIGGEQNEGCPVFEESCGVNCSCPKGYTCSSSDPLICKTQGVCVPLYNSPQDCVHQGAQGNVYGNTLCTTCPCDSALDFLADIRRCDIVFPAITSPSGDDIYSRGDTWQIK